MTSGKALVDECSNCKGLHLAWPRKLCVAHVPGPSVGLRHHWAVVLQLRRRQVSPIHLHVQHQSWTDVQKKSNIAALISFAHPCLLTLCMSIFDSISFRKDPHNHTAESMSRVSQKPALANSQRIHERMSVQRKIPTKLTMFLQCSTCKDDRPLKKSMECHLEEIGVNPHLESLNNGILWQLCKVLQAHLYVFLAHQRSLSCGFDHPCGLSPAQQHYVTCIFCPD